MTTFATLFEEYEKLPHVGIKLTPLIHKLCGKRYIDLLLHLPANYLYRKWLNSIDDAISGELVTLEVTITASNRPRNKKQPLIVYAADAHGEQIELMFFRHGPWITKTYTNGKKLCISGHIERTLTGAKIVHPESFSATSHKSDISGYFPVYPLSKGVTNTVMMRAAKAALLLLDHEEIEDWIPEDILKEHNWPSFKKAFHALHTPKTEEDIRYGELAKERLAFDELYAWQLALGKARDKTKSMPGIAHTDYNNLRGKFLESLPFELTTDQQQTFEEIIADMTQETPMLRLVQGDVGSGKTMVAFLSLLLAIENGQQGAMMAPTEVLAIQLFENAQKYFKPLGITCALLTGKVKAKEKKEIKKGILSGEIDILIGTHALIEADVLFKSISLCVIDEQHRFGVKQRLALTNQSTVPDLLVMSATPIPRTLALTAYGDMDISIIAEKPPGRTPISTSVLPIERLDDMVHSLKRLIDKGEQVYWICPLVEESEKLDLAAVTERFKTLTNVYGEDVCLLHGKMKGKEKEETLAAFKAGTYKIIVSTTVVEVGVDVPNATCIIIEHAERFGLSQLHQLRGRVGRGSIASHCILLYAQPLGKFAEKRLDILRKSDDGFALAEKDLELRGPGEVLGTAQAGHFVTRVANMLEHRHLIPLARDLARSEHHGRYLPYLIHTFKKQDADKMIKAG